MTIRLFLICYSWKETGLGQWRLTRDYVIVWWKQNTEACKHVGHNLCYSENVESEPNTK